MSQEKVYRRRATGLCKRMENEGLRQQCVWIPGTPAKLTPIKQSKNESILSFPEEEITGTQQEQSFRGIEIGLIDLNKSIDEIDESKDVSLSDFNSNFFAFAVPERVTDVHVMDLNQGIDDTEAQLTGTGIPSSIVASQEPTQQEEEAEVVDRMDKTGNLFVLVDSPTDATTKENLLLPNSNLLLGSNQLNDVNNAENPQNVTNSPESCDSLSQHDQHNVPEEVISPTGAENLNPQAESKKSGRKQKTKRKKHRPRVLVEPKPKKIPQPKTPKPKKTPQPKTPKQTTTKRKRANGSTKTRKQDYSPSEDVVDKSVSSKRRCVKENKAITAIAPACTYRPRRARRALNFDDDNLLRAIQALYFNNFSRATRSNRRRRLNTLFMRLPVGHALPKRMKRLRRATRRRNLNLLTGIPICNQLPKLSPKQDSQTNNIQTNGGKNVVERTEMEPCLVDLELQLFSSLKYEAPNLTDSLGLPSQSLPSQEFGALELFPEVQGTEVLLDQRFFPEVFEFNSLVQGIYSREELFPEQRINLQDFLPGQEIGSLEVLEEQIMCSLEHLQEQKMSSEHTDPFINKNPGDLRQLIAESRGSRKEIIQVQRNDFAIQKRFPLESRDSASQEENKDLFITDGGQSGLGTVVPYQEPDKRKKRLTAKVDLDPETLRRWNLIMNIDDGTTTDDQKTDEEKEKWWETERNVFEGRIKSFTSRLHQFLGDRRFKPWKGSVVDSVVGVYLTQNVSDNLSSSAYMSLASKFPLKSTANHTEVMRSTMTSIEGSMYYVTEPELEPDESYELKDRVEHLEELNDRMDDLDELNDRIEHLNRVEHLEELNDRMDHLDELNDRMEHLKIGDIKVMKDTVSLSSSVENFKADASPHKSFNMDSIDIASTKIPQVPVTTLQQQDYKSEKRLKNGYPTSTRLDNGNQASTSGRNDLKIACGSISLPNFHNLFEISKIDEPMNKKRPREKGPKLKEYKSNTKKDGTKMSIPKKKNDNREQQDWELLRRMHSSGKERGSDEMDSVDWEAVRCAEISEIADAIKERGQHNIIAGRIKDFLNRLVELHNCIDLEWLRNIPPEKVKEYLLEIQGLGLKSVECVRLLSLQHIAFPVDVNVGRIAVRLGWVPLQTLPGDLHLHLLEEYPLMDSIQKYLWPRLCYLDQRTLYELHYQMITFGKVFCTKRSPKCGTCPLRGECKHFASAFASTRLALPGPSEKGTVKSEIFKGIGGIPPMVVNPIPVIHIEADPVSESGCQINNCEPFIEEPSSPEPILHTQSPEPDSEEDFSIGDIEDIPTIRLQEREFRENVQSFLEMNKIKLQDSRALVSLTAEAALMPVRELKRYSNLRTEHLVYVLPKNHEVLLGFERLEPDDPCPYLLAIWSPGETPNSFEPPKNKCNSEECKLCYEQTCYSCNKIREQHADIVRGTILIPCRTANRGRFPLNGTYFQVNEVFADHETSYHPINVPRNTIANLPTQTTYFGTSATSIYKGLDLAKIQTSFWRGFICVRGFDRKTRAPRPLSKRFHISPSKMGKQNKDG